MVRQSWQSASIFRLPTFVSADFFCLFLTLFIPTFDPSATNQNQNRGDSFVKKLGQFCGKKVARNFAIVQRRGQQWVNSLTCSDLDYVLAGSLKRKSPGRGGGGGRGAAISICNYIPLISRALLIQIHWLVLNVTIWNGNKSKYCHPRFCWHWTKLTCWSNLLCESCFSN